MIGCMYLLPFFYLEKVPVDFYDALKFETRKSYTIEFCNAVALRN